MTSRTRLLTLIARGLQVEALIAAQRVPEMHEALRAAEQELWKYHTEGQAE